MSRSSDQTPRVVHHALLNHISVISTYAQLLRSSALDEDQRELVSELTRSVDEAHELAIDLGIKLQLHPSTDDDPDREGGYA